MHDLSWLMSHRLQSVTRREFDWVFRFDSDIALTSECLWRFLESGRISITSQDDGHQFGHPDPRDAEAILNKALSGNLILRVELRAGTLDLDLHFTTDRILQFIPSSSGYESWKVSYKGGELIACGGGELFKV